MRINVDGTAIEKQPKPIVIFKGEGNVFKHEIPPYHPDVSVYLKPSGVVDEDLMSLIYAESDRFLVDVVVRHAKDESAKPQAVTEQAAKDQFAKGQTATGEAAKPQAGREKASKDHVAKGQTAKGQAPKPQAATLEGGNKRDPTAGFVADWVAAKNEAAKQQEANEDDPEEQPEEPAHVRPFEVHLNYGQPNSTTSNIELE